MTPKVLTAGEALVDWVSTERGADLDAAGHFHKSAGGAPLNVAVGLARLGTTVGFCGCLADDPFGRWLRRLMEAEGVSTERVSVARDRQTRMAYVVTTADGDRRLAAFSQGDCADAAISAAELPGPALAAARAFCFGSLILVGAPAREAVLDAALAVKAGAGLSVFDPNIRPVLWPDEGELRAVVEAAMARADVVKLGDDELAFLTGEADVRRGAERILARHDLQALVVTRGPVGSYVRTPALEAEAASFSVTAVEATGAGDGFVAGLLSALARVDRLAALGAADWRRMLREANAVGALATTRPGAMAALPTRAELEAFLAAR